MATRALVNSPTPLSVTWYNPNTETPVDADAAVTVTATHVNGALLLNGATAVHGATGVYTSTLPPQANPADVTVVWTGTFSGTVRVTTQYLTLVGAFYVELADLRLMDGLANATQYPTATLLAKREEAETVCEQATGKAWVQRYARDVLDGDPSYRRASMVTTSTSYYQSVNLTRRLSLGQRVPRKILAIYIDDGTGRQVTDGVTASNTTVTSATAAFTATDVGKGISGGSLPSGTTIQTVNSATSVTVSQAATASATAVTLVVSGMVAQTDLTQYKLYSSGEIERTLTSQGWPRGIDNVIIEYIYGEDAPPSDISGAVKRHTRYLVLESNSRISDRTLQYTNELGTFQLAQAKGYDRPTGLSEVDAVYARYGYRAPVIA